jgi:nitrogen fixation NifU-like protein
MLDQVEALYREVILDHYKNSSHHGELPKAQIKAEGTNPLCGDEMIFYVQLQGDRIDKVRFQGKGCAISQAAASMLAGELEGKSLGQAQQLIQAMKAMMRGEALPAPVTLGELEALAGVRQFPVRVKCAALSWNVVEQGLQQQRGAHGHQ